MEWEWNAGQGQFPRSLEGPAWPEVAGSIRVEWGAGRTVIILGHGAQGKGLVIGRGKGGRWRLVSHLHHRTPAGRLAQGPCG